MLADQRRAEIAAELSAAGAVRVADLVTRYEVSDMTIRRDLEFLEERGRARRVHGGAVDLASVAEEPGFEAKSALGLTAKRAIARRAAELVAPGSAIGISGGTTTWLLAEDLRGTVLSVVTNSLTAAETLRDCENLVVTGGARTRSAALVGPVADRSLEQLRVDQLFLGVHGIDPVAGLTTPNLAEARTNATFIGQARTLIVLADSSKWLTVGLAAIAPLTAVDVLITDDGLPATARSELAAAVGELIIVPAH